MANGLGVARGRARTRLLARGECSAMPIPTDTYWNIKRLNIVFAASAVILMAVTGWSILQDFNQGWRHPQREGKVWQAAFVDEKIQRDRTPELEQELANLRKTQAEQSKTMGPDAPEV